MEAKENEDIGDMDGKIKRYEALISIWRRHDESYWTSVNMFILIEGLLLAGYSQIIDRPKILLYFYCFAGILIGIVWLFVLHRKIAYIYISQDVGIDLEEKIYSDLKKGGLFSRSKNIFENSDEEWFNKYFGRRRIFAKIGLAFFTSFVFIIIMIVIWILILLATWCCLNA